MSNRLALVLGLIIVGGAVLDLVLQDGATLMVLLRKFLEFVEWAAFWR